MDVIIYHNPQCGTSRNTLEHRAEKWTRFSAPTMLSFMEEASDGSQKCKSTFGSDALGLIRNAGIEPHIVEYLKCPPTRLLLRQLVERMGLSVRDAMRVKGTPFQELQLGDPTLSDDQLLDAMMEHPILIERPIVVTPMGVRICRPSETVLDILPPQQGEFTKEDSEPVVDTLGRRVGIA